MCALWPAGIAIASVTGTDMPATALIVVAVWLLVRESGRHPLGGPLLYGLVLGLAAYLRAVALPLAALAAPHFRARGAAWGHVITRTLAACLVAVLVLLPWGIRNKMRYGEFFLTDSHGGHTALVGSNPNSEGNYSRSLNRLFAEGSGYKLFATPHRASDRAAFKLAVQWTKAEPKYALGLLVGKADRLLTHERPLLYWPLYRQSVLPPTSRAFAWFTAHRTGVERVVDWFWYVFVAAVLVGVIAAFARRNRTATSLLPIPLALAALYVLFFAEARYHLPVAALLMPFAGAGVVWVGEAVRDLARFTIDRQRRPRLLYEGLMAVVAIAALFIALAEDAGRRGAPARRASLGGRRVQRRRRQAGVRLQAGARARGALTGAWHLGRIRASSDAARHHRRRRDRHRAARGQLPRVDARRLRRQLPRRRGGRPQRGRRRVAAHTLARARIDRRDGSPGHARGRKNAFRGPRPREKTCTLPGTWRHYGFRHSRLRANHVDA